MQKENEKINGSDIMEGLTSISAVIKAIEANTTDRRISAVYVDKSKKRSKQREVSFLSRKSGELGFSLEFVDEDAINEFTVGNSHGGIIAFCSPRNIPELSAESIKKNGVYYFLEGVEDPYNFGYAIRSIYAAGGTGIILSRRNWMGVAGVVARSSAGSSELIDIRRMLRATSPAVRCITSKTVSAGSRWLRYSHCAVLSPLSVWVWFRSTPSPIPFRLPSLPIPQSSK